MNTRLTITTAVLGLVFGILAFSTVSTVQAIGFDLAMEWGAFWVGALFFTICPALVFSAMAIIGFVVGDEEI